MQNSDILNGKPFSDINLKTKVNRLDNETPSITRITHSSVTNPTTTETTFLETTTLTSKQNLFVDVDSIFNITSNITGAQDFTFKLYVADTVVAQSVVSIPDALNTLISVNLTGFAAFSKLNSTNREYTGSLVATPLATSASASVSTVTVVNTQSDVASKAQTVSDMDIKLTCTASVGSATTVVTCLTGRLLADKTN